MDKNSPWCKLNENNGKAIFLGNKFHNGNILVYIMENIFQDEFPRPVFHNKTSKIKYLDDSGDEKTIDIYMLSPYAHFPNALENFGEYLIEKYDIYNIKEFSNNTVINVFNTKDQYDILYQEMKNNVTWHDPQFW